MGKNVKSNKSKMFLNYLEYWKKHEKLVATLQVPTKLGQKQNANAHDSIRNIVRFLLIDGYCL